MKLKRCNNLPGLLLLLTILVGTAAARSEVTVHGVASSTGEYVTVELRAEIVNTPIISYTARVSYDPRILQVIQAFRNDAVWYLSDGTTPVPYMQPDTSRRGQVLFVGARMDGANPLEGVLGNNVLLGTVVFSRLSPDIPAFGVEIGHTGAFASFVTTEGEVLEAQSGQLVWEEIQPTPGDRDLDSLDDEWEAQYFKDPKLVYYSDDPDGDGVNNQGEQDLGSDPTDPNSNLRLAIRRGKGQVTLQWDSFPDRSYTVEAGEEPNRFKPLQSGLRATPPRNVHTVDLGGDAEARFFRIRLEAREK